MDLVEVYLGGGRFGRGELVGGALVGGGLVRGQFVGVGFLFGVKFVVV